MHVLNVNMYLLLVSDQSPAPMSPRGNRVTSLIKKHPHPRTTIEPRRSPTVGSYGVTLSYGRGTPVEGERLRNFPFPLTAIASPGDGVATNTIIGQIMFFVQGLYSRSPFLSPEKKNRNHNARNPSATLTPGFDLRPGAGTY